MAPNLLRVMSYLEHDKMNEFLFNLLDVLKVIKVLLECNTDKNDTRVKKISLASCEVYLFVLVEHDKYVIRRIFD